MTLILRLIFVVLPLLLLTAAIASNQARAETSGASPGSEILFKVPTHLKNTFSRLDDEGRARPADQSWPLGRFIGQAMRQAASADLAFLSSGAFSRGLTGGDEVTEATLKNILPGDRTLLVASLSGGEVAETIRDMLRKSAYEAEAWLQLDGLTVIVDPKKDERLHPELVEIFVDGAPIDSRQTYRVALTDPPARGRLEAAAGRPLTEALAEVFRQDPAAGLEDPAQAARPLRPGVYAFTAGEWPRFRKFFMENEAGAALAQTPPRAVLALIEMLENQSPTLTLAACPRPGAGADQVHFDAVYEIDFTELKNLRRVLYIEDGTPAGLLHDSVRLVKLGGLKDKVCGEPKLPADFRAVGFRLAGNKNVAFGLNAADGRIDVYDPRQAYFWPDQPILRSLGAFAAVEEMLSPYVYRTYAKKAFGPAAAPATGDDRFPAMKDPFKPGGSARYLDVFNYGYTMRPAIEF